MSRLFSCHHDAAHLSAQLYALGVGLDTSCPTTTIVCSLCIRRALLGERKCPVCMVMVSKDELIGNHLIDQLVNSFVTARPTLLTALLGTRRQEGGRSPQSQRGEGPSSPQPSSPSPPEGRRHSQRISHGKEGRGEHVNGPAGTGDIQCPVCQTHFGQSIIAEHVEQCLLQASAMDGLAGRVDPPAAERSATRSTPLVLMKRPVYNLLRDAELRKILRELGLPPGGDRDVRLSRRNCPPN